MDKTLKVYKVEFFVPMDYAEIVKNAVFDAGGGKLGNYERCCWQTSGQGEFLPQAGSNAFIGKVGVVEKVPELKVELVVSENYLTAVLAALKENHPYETPAVYYYLINNI